MKSFLLKLIAIIVFVDRADAQNTPPTIDNLPVSKDVKENLAAGTSIFQPEITDPDTADTHTYRVSLYSPNNGEDYFAINTDTGVITTTANNIDFEASHPPFELSIEVFDGTDTDTGVLTLNIVNVNENPYFDPAAYTLDGPEGPVIVLGTPSFVVKDPDAGDTNTYSLSCGAYTGKFLMAAATGEISYQTDYWIYDGNPASVPCTVYAIDAGGLNGTADLTINIQTINTDPKFNESVYYFTVDYYTEVGTRIGTLNASDADTGTYGQLVSYSLNQASLGDNYFGVTNGGELFSNMNMSGLGDSMTVSFTATVTDGGGKTDITTVNVQILESTTVTSTVIYKEFGDYPSNVAWVILASLLALGTLAFAGWLIYTCRGPNSWANMKKLVCPEKRLYNRWNDPATPRRYRRRPGRYPRRFQFWAAD